MTSFMFARLRRPRQPERGLQSRRAVRVRHDPPRPEPPAIGHPSLGLEPVGRPRTCQTVSCPSDSRCSVAQPAALDLVDADDGDPACLSALDGDGRDAARQVGQRRGGRALGRDHDDSVHTWSAR
ncbi:hypothetical protein [Nonomuraea dietziae]|uniref:hypothetical protein n=1 Tax=Nonomuraea dietziae TaxID=65515 RepID=UPI0031DD7D8F